MDITDIGWLKQKKKKKTLPTSYEYFTSHLTKVEAGNPWLQWQAAYFQSSSLLLMLLLAMTSRLSMSMSESPHIQYLVLQGEELF